MNRPIGVFDSGVGGITVAKEIIRQLPNESIYFYGDIKNCPYGDKNSDEILKYTDDAIHFLIKKGVKLVVIACNTATAASLEILRKKYTIPIIGVIKSGAVTALQTTNIGKVLVLGTNFTAKSEAYSKEIHKINKDIIVHNKACKSFVPFVENKDYENEDAAYNIVNNELSLYKNIDVDTIILGCTHYPLLQKYIEKYFNNEKMVISSGKETAREVSSILTFLELHTTKLDKEYKFFVSQKSDKFIATAEKWLNLDIDVNVIDVEDFK
ncbi:MULTISPECIES: glutamate racemase [unclassified Gemella]|uniref:glutamate racemase n=1 Tax=unclassified Gemella TaxID=2624949 RepID=UPI00107426CF|nr:MULTISPECIES: glutamate racemase [unclassified Gemella]MBF0710149.1 glutamate racemase [Gemella sp. GL1.1]MBF0746228.1 glutamate racemase [Gemella sp. 19428wG2_WT2a]NYS27493.1 glutamate racemase [Gemella sp. GL1]TFU60510.1 glutamate racemase [Gemella sp. WT2a]